MRKLVIVLFILLLLEAVSGCTSPVRRQLERAEAVMESAPDSALAILDSIDTASLTRASDRALYALLLSQGREKNYAYNDSGLLIQEAVTFYSKNGDEYRKMLAQYYLGNAYYRKENYSACISLYFSSLKLAEKLNDHFRIAMCSRGISDVYNNTFNGSEELVYAKKEYENFLKTGKTSHIDYAVLDLCRAYNNNNLYDSCENRLKALIDTAIKRNDDYLLYETQKCLGLTYLRKHDYRANFKIVKSVCASHYANSEDSAYLSMAYLNMGDIAESERIHASLQDSNVINDYLEYKLLYENNDLRGAISYLEKKDEKTNEIFKSRISQDLTTSLIKDFDSREKATSTELKYTKITLFLIAVSSLFLISILAFIFFAYRKRVQGKEDKYILFSQELKDSLSSKDKSIRELMMSRYVLFDQLCQVLYEQGETESSKKKLMKSIVDLKQSFISDNKKIADLENYVNIHFDNILVELRLALPKLKEIDFRLFLFSALGFSINAISMFLEVDKISKVYDRKRRLKDKIKTLSDMQREKFLKFLG